jgi:arylsulfatase A-like enzyme
LLARRLAEAGVRFIQVTSKGWDHHGTMYRSLKSSCAKVDKPIAGLLTDLKRRGLLDDTLVIWTGEFGRTPLVQGVKGKKEINFDALGRGHNSYGWSLWLAGGGVKAGIRHGQTDDFGFQAVENPVHIHDLHATILHLLGLDHEKLTYRHAGRNFRLTDVHGRVLKEILA